MSDQNPTGALHCHGASPATHPEGKYYPGTGTGAYRRRDDMSRTYQEPNPLTPGDVVMARRMFWQTYMGTGSGWFASNQSCDDLFDDLAEAGAFTDEWLKAMADRVRAEENPEAASDA